MSRHMYQDVNVDAALIDAGYMQMIPKDGAAT